MKRMPYQRPDRQLSAREHVAVGMVLVLTVPSIASLILAVRFIGRIIQPIAFLIHYTIIGLLLGFAVLVIAQRIAPRVFSDVPFRRIKQAVIFLTVFGATSAKLGAAGILNAKLDRSEGAVENAVVVFKEKRRLYKHHAHYITLSLASTLKEILVSEQQWNSLSEGDPVGAVIRGGFLGYRHIDRIAAGRIEL